ncbi:MAG: BTAD domain-containing putative transcriptional regulator [Verrucomicrobiota bacterium]
MEFRILGPLEVVEDGRPVEVGGQKQRALLALLLLDANSVVSRDRLIDALWEDDPPETALKALQVYVSNLRKQLGRDRIVTKAPGYAIRVEPGELDLERFERLAADGDPPQLAEALALWRGPPLADFAQTRFALSEIGRLDERRLAVVEDRIEADLALCRHAGLVSELEVLVAEHPLRERLWGQLMLALYRSGRQAEALDAYRAARRALVDELGIEPGRALRDLHQRILNQDPALDLDGRPTAEPVGGEQGGGFVGREPELAELTAGLGEVLGGRGRLFLLQGEPGIGKSRLADELISRAKARGTTVLVGRCWEAGGAPPYWPWTQSLRAYVRGADPDVVRRQLGAHGADVAQIVLELRELFPDLPEPGSEPFESDAARFRLFDSTAMFLRAASAQRPLVLVFDDLHAADEPSLLLLRYVASVLEDSRILVVGTFRDLDPTVRDPLETTVAELGREPVTRRIRLEGLSRQEVGRLAELTASAVPSERLVAELYSETEGNPLFVSEIVRLLAAEGRLDGAEGRIPIPETIREAIGRRLRILSDECRRVLSLGSVFGREFGLVALERVADYTGIDTLLSVLDEAITARVVEQVPGSLGRLRFGHALTRETLYEAIPATHRTRLHRRVAEVLEALYAGNPDPHLAELAHHFSLAVPAAPPEKAVEYATRAAGLAAQLLAYEEAVRFYELALTLSADEVSRCDILLGLGDALARAGDTPASKRRFTEAAQLAEKRGLAERLAHAALGYGGRIVWEVSRDDDRLIPLLERAFETLPTEDSPLRVRLLARLAGPLRDARFPAERRHAIADQALAMARRMRDRSTLAYALAGYLPAHMSPARTHQIVELATELITIATDTGELERAVEGYLCRACALLELGEVDRAREDAVEMTKLAKELCQPSQLLYAANFRAHLALLAGDFQEAAQLVEEGLDLGHRAQRWNARITYRLQLYMLRKSEGRLAEVVGIYEEQPSAFEYRTYRIFGCVLSRIYDELGRRDEARATFEELAENDFAGVPFDEEWLASICLLAETAASLGDLRRVRVLSELLSPYADRVGTSYPEISVGAVARYLGLLSATGARWGEAQEHFTTALDVNRRIGARPWLGHTQEDFARMLLQRGDPGDPERARELLDRAVTTYGELGMEPHAARATALARGEPAARR